MASAASMDAPCSGHAASRQASSSVAKQRSYAQRSKDQQSSSQSETAGAHSGVREQLHSTQPSVSGTWGVHSGTSVGGGCIGSGFIGSCGVEPPPPDRPAFAGGRAVDPPAGPASAHAAPRQLPPVPLATESGGDGSGEDEQPKIKLTPSSDIPRAQFQIIPTPPATVTHL